jgi:type IV fimbrial biogenesis protein FimT
MHQASGFTLSELLVTIAMVAVMVAWSTPVFRDLHCNAVRTREVNQFVQAVHFARGEAMKRNGVVSLCPTLGTDHCAPPGTPWTGGWIVFFNVDGDAPAVRDAGEELLHTFPAWPTGQIVANRTTLSFRAFGQSGVTATFTFCDSRGSAAARAVIISQTGRPRVASRSASGSSLQCA